MRKLYSKKMGVYFSFILIVISLSGFADNQNRSYYITYSNKEISLKDFFKIINKETKLTVFYNNQLLNDQEKVKVAFNKASIKDVLDNILKGRELDWEINNDFILIKKKSKISTSTKVKQQQERITGKVIDEQGLPLPGVSVNLKDSRAGTVTDSEGNYEIAVQASAALVFSFIGYEKQEIVVTNAEKPLTV